MDALIIGFACLLIAHGSPAAPAQVAAARPDVSVLETERAPADLAGTAELGACCVGLICIPNLTPENCYDTGGVWQGDAIGCAQAVCVAVPSCPGGALLENEGDCGQPQPDNYNGGPNSPSCIFFPDFASDTGTITLCATTSADRRNQSNRDTDWLRLTPLESTQYTACTTGQTAMQVQFWRLGTLFDPCGTTTPLNAASGNAGTPVCASQCLFGGQQFAIRNAPVFNAIGSQTHDPQRFGIACSRYNMSITTSACPAGACCNPNQTCSNNVVGLDCTAGGGVYNGDGSNCATSTCGGACCQQNGTCAFSSQANCIAAGGAYTNGVVCAQVEPCPICQPEDPNDIDGGDGADETCDLSDVDANPGCTNGGSGTFTLLSCNETVCGRAAFDTTLRDLDWYHIVVAQETEMLITVNNGLVGGGRLLFRFRYYPGQQPSPEPPTDPCSSAGAFEVVPATRGNLLPAGETVFPIVVPAGTYTLLIAYDVNTPGPPVPECPANYRVSFECATPACAFACRGDAVDAEAEPGCGLPAQTNAGCSVAPTAEAFTPISLNQRACGTSRLVQLSDVGGLTVARDVDWYAITLAAGDYVVEFAAEFHSVLLMRRIDSLSNPNCTNPNIFGFVVFQCANVGIDVPELAAGTYAIFVSPDFSSYAWFLGPPTTAAQEFCPSPYQLRVALKSECGLSPCADSNCDGFVTVGDIGYFVDAVIGGPTAWANRFLPGTPACDFVCANDTNNDGFVTVGDIGTFVAAITGTPCP